MFNIIFSSLLSLNRFWVILRPDFFSPSLFARGEREREKVLRSLGWGGRGSEGIFTVKMLFMHEEEGGREMEFVVLGFILPINGNKALNHEVKAIRESRERTRWFRGCGGEGGRKGDNICAGDWFFFAVGNSSYWRSIGKKSEVKKVERRLGWLVDNVSLPFPSLHDHQKASANPPANRLQFQAPHHPHLSTPPFV